MSKSLVLELQKELLDNAAPLSQLIIKAWVVAKKLKLEDDAEQFRKEFDGYEYSYCSNVPNYRRAKGKVQKYQAAEWKDIDEDGCCIDSKSFYHKNPIVDFPFFIRKPIRNLEKELDVINCISETIKFNDLPYEIKMKRIRYHEDQDQYRCVYNPDVHLDILHEIKMKLIEWTMSLSENGILGNNMSFEEDEKEMAKQIIHVQAAMLFYKTIPTILPKL